MTAAAHLARIRAPNAESQSDSFSTRAEPRIHAEYASASTPAKNDDSMSKHKVRKTSWYPMRGCPMTLARTKCDGNQKRIALVANEQSL